ncbi:hypothetical protein [Streptomyces sp. NK08204]|uniref:hypothetical protein n=1 Tax=Streptomyces sp. NK08204 TaxID=2873260 RepID=UPI001CEC90B9|nr:hypothetical protein [Streptomyces sp. NK08204]
MRKITEAAFRFPTVTCTAALVLLAGLWALTLLESSKHHRIAQRTGADPLDATGTPVIPAASLVIVLA